MNTTTKAELKKAVFDRYEKILAAAHSAAAAAVETASKQYNEMIGACGFAWVKIDGTEPLAHHCRKQIKKIQAKYGDYQSPENSRAYNNEVRMYGDKGYPNGWQFWNPGNHNGQRIDIKEAGAKAFVEELARHGIRGDFGSRLD